MTAYDWQADIEEIRRLLAEAYQHWENESDDHHCKSSEGAISLHFPSFFWREDEADVERASRLGPAVEVYSYVLGPSRSHWFSNARLALAEVMEWHRDEMAHKYEVWA